MTLVAKPWLQSVTCIASASANRARPTLSPNTSSAHTLDELLPPDMETLGASKEQYARRKTALGSQSTTNATM